MKGENRETWIDAALEVIKQDSLHRTLRAVATAPTARLVINGREVIQFASNNYLGLSTHPKVVEAAVAATHKFGVGASGSRLMTGNSQLYEALEAKIAAAKGTPASLVFSSGYLANISTIPALAGEGDVIYSDALNHASIIDGCRLSRATKKVYRHGDVEHLETLLAESTGFRRRLIITDGVFSMDGDIAPLPEICELADRYGAMVMVDDAHGFGVLGACGGGVVEHFGLETHNIIQMGTLSKAVGGLGGYVAGSRALIDYLVNRGRGFIFTTGLPPATLAAASAAIDVIRTQPEHAQRLHANARWLRSALTEAGYQVLPGETQIIPVIVGENERATRLADALFENGVYVPAIRPPTVPEGTSRLRLSVMATHTMTDLETAMRAFLKAWASLTRR